MWNHVVLHRAPREITAMNIHQAVGSIPTCDFLTNAHMGYLSKDNWRPLELWGTVTGLSDWPGLKLCSIIPCTVSIYSKDVLCVYSPQITNGSNTAGNVQLSALWCKCVFDTLGMESLHFQRLYSTTWSLEWWVFPCAAFIMGEWRLMELWGSVTAADSCPSLSGDLNRFVPPADVTQIYSQPQTLMNIWVSGNCRW